MVSGLQKKDVENVRKNNIRTLGKAHAYFQTILKGPVNFQKDHPKTVGGVARTRFIFPVHFCGIRSLKSQS